MIDFPKIPTTLPLQQEKKDPPRPSHEGGSGETLDFRR